MITPVSAPWAYVKRLTMINERRIVFIMVRITHKELAAIMGISEGYSQQLFHRRGLKMTNRYLKEIVGLICERIENTHNRTGKKLSARQLDKL